MNPEEDDEPDRSESPGTHHRVDGVGGEPSDLVAGGRLRGHHPGRLVPPASPAKGPVGPLRASGGPELTDRYGRVVLPHGADLVYKTPPYEVVVNGTGRNLLTPAAARRMAQLGFDVVRLGVIWKGLEPGRGTVNDAATCTRGAPRVSATSEFDARTFDTYMNRLGATVSLLARNGISSLIDIHQDVYNEAFGGEGAPDWAVCTDGITPAPQRHLADWSRNLTGPDPRTARAARDPWAARAAATETLRAACLT